MRFEWDDAKDRANLKKHGVSFDEASKIFDDDASVLELFDTAHSDLEDRFISIGPIKRGLVLVVWTERDGDTVRIISARWATPRESERYRKYIKGNL